MKSRTFGSAVTLLLVLIAFSQQGTQGLEVGFGQKDYAQTEGNGGIEIEVQKRGKNEGKLVVTIETLTYAEVEESKRPNVELPDPAEYDMAIGGRQDFKKTTKVVEFEPSEFFQEKKLFLDFIDDEINELNEGFLLVLRVNEAASHPDDLTHLEYIFDGVALVVIVNDDEISISFESLEYEVLETAGKQDRLIALVKDDDRVTERSLDVLVQLSPLSGDAAARIGFDYQLNKMMIELLTFPPSQQILYIPFLVIDDNIAEFRERFNLIVSVPRNGGYRVGDKVYTDVYIKDDDSEGIRIDFEKQEYTVTEGENLKVDVCLNVVGTNQFDFELFGSFSTTAESAAMFVDFTPPSDLSISISPSNARPCISVTINDDQNIETTERFGVTVIFEAFGDMGLERLTDVPITTSVVIRDNDRSPVDPCTLCGPNSVCIHSRCVCLTGYYKVGGDCVDIPECSMNIDNCSPNAYCRNTVGSFTCTCKEGYRGNGRTCQRIPVDPCASCGPNSVCSHYKCVCRTGYHKVGDECVDISECSMHTDNCSPNAYCRNTVGSFTCTCKEGYRGNGRTCQRINPCDACGPNSMCDGSRCLCIRGYHKVKGTCVDIDECSTNTDNCSPFGTCQNTVGSFTCTCRKGFGGDGKTCRNINECTTKLHNCHRNANCQDRFGSFVCRCRPGYRGNGLTCSQINRINPAPAPAPTPVDKCSDRSRTSRSHGRSRSRSGTDDCETRSSTSRSTKSRTTKRRRTKSRTTRRRG